jgi:hypothetical protein
MVAEARVPSSSQELFPIIGDDRVFSTLARAGSAAAAGTGAGAGTVALLGGRGRGVAGSGAVTVLAGASSVRTRECEFARCGTWCPVRSSLSVLGEWLGGVGNWLLASAMWATSEERDVDVLECLLIVADCGTSRYWLAAVRGRGSFLAGVRPRFCNICCHSATLPPEDRPTPSEAPENEQAEASDGGRRVATNAGWLDEAEDERAETAEDSEDTRTCL